MIARTLAILFLAIAARADISDSGNLTIGGTGVIQGTMTVQGNALSVGGSTFGVNGGSITLGGRLNAAAAGIKWADGTTSTTAASGDGGTSGGVRQTISTYTAISYLCGQIPRDDSIPQNSEGTAVVEVSITPQVATSSIVISGAVYAGLAGGGNTIVAALFKDSDANSISVSASGGLTNTGAVRAVPVSYIEASGSTSARTYKLRCGGEASNSIRLNGESARVYGGLLKSGFMVQEVGP